MTIKEKFKNKTSMGVNPQALIGFSLSLTASLSGSCCYWLALSPPPPPPPRLARLLIALTRSRYTRLVERRPRERCDSPHGLCVQTLGSVFLKYCSCFGDRGESGCVFVRRLIGSGGRNEVGLGVCSKRVKRERKKAIWLMTHMHTAPDGCLTPAALSTAE